MPKWTNKGHEFDELGEIFKQNSKIVYMGKYDDFVCFKNKLNFIDELNIQINDSIPELKFKWPLNKLFDLLISTKKREITKHSDEIVILSNKNKRWLKLFLKRGYEENKTVFVQDVFEKKYLPIYALYVQNKMYSYYSTCIVLTTLCTLNCKYCLNYQPYIKNKKHYSYEQLKNDIDAFFSCFDKVEYFSLTGGEPLLYKELPDLIEYVGSNYGNKINHLWFATNGTLVPSDELCKIIKDNNVEIVCDNYTKFVPEIINTYKAMVEKLKKYGITYQEGNSIKFFKTFPPKNDYTKYSENKMLNKFNLCKEQYSGFGLADGKLYQCCYSLFANTAGLVNEIETDYINLKNYRERNKKELLEYILGYTTNGYSRFCEYCNCFYGIHNGEYDENGVTQQPKKELLEWDINNPTYL